MVNVLITAGPTQEAIDPIRYISNNASGKQGYAIAEYMNKIGWKVNLVSGPVTIHNHNIQNILHVKNCNEMLQTCIELLPVDIAIFTAAVTDWCPTYSVRKIKKHEITNIKVTNNPDIIHCISTHEKRPKLVIGFSLESENVIENAKIKLKRKQCDWIISNTTTINNEHVMGNDYNKITIITKDHYKEFPIMSKKEIGQLITEEIINFLAKINNTKS
ncbi:DNA / pantothenate metabolism flavofamily protein [Ehrlichia chaffeensis str. Heartland]|uniref:DNA / pantothenate metabolism flavoprotein family protein n=1 Tax=Ehrlichia chaffeensis (strain ATCC CRL-10679 / Arkansas) TaxID=205920 RepID=Q2GH89_EHRCR|nr:phosphopantothenoylcysteine decarboxylase [Ehrlichia chaffeensis]ABD44687.1 DNA / pantothenate metabolism flavoprotein family protein [Ehrlichia chaffeensis str. Arkansas]AHX03483.1 DNA / pantothenate metabolism flavofamily protein [Ehrlichia chaffeensis str. Heartland]AHX05797.1 DNA / pantothenate metabolism flavofamily protein [Ehrlichia chaffeensis str. Jax]AHX06789.1 DNA / pantothenate metabolism flavofamily protein [Ehrlichia chaffeensis str. Liberty]AHX07370.1 DNA / pantothenate metab